MFSSGSSIKMSSSFSPRPPGGRGRPPKCLARCFRAGCWAGTEDVPDCHLPGRRMECTHGIKTSVLSPVQLPVGVYRALFLQNKEEL